MTRFLLSGLFLFLTLSLVAQENSFITIGVGYPFITGAKVSDNAHYDYNINSGNYNLFLEKELKLLKKTPQILLTPGLAFTGIKETYKLEALGGGGDGDFQHRAFSTYLKVIYEIDRQPYVVTDYYFGVHAGCYINSKTTGSTSSWQLNPDGGKYTNSEEIDKSGNDFFHLNYFGIIAGIRPLGDAENFLKPTIELAFYPSFATLNSYYNNLDEKKSMFQISIGIVVGKKPKTN
ncbi:hypothetical protein [uncultured Draconibacterium sp.]|uniref:hypothetical protein n=1 Tax=uncultured Draconibacterium sp. TaxID=1573823 RepID=UPI00321702E4